MTPLALRSILLALAFSALSCAATPEPETPEELLFTVPSWCSWGYTPSPRAQSTPVRAPSRLRPAKPRSDWTRWAQARQASTDGPGLCGVRLPIAAAREDGDEPAGEPGICMEIQGNELQRVAIQDDQGTPVLAELEPPAPGSAWRGLKLQGAAQKKLYVRVNGRAIEAYLEGSGEQARGPCFYGK